MASSGSEHSINTPMGLLDLLENNTFDGEIKITADMFQKQTIDTASWKFGDSPASKLKPSSATSRNYQKQSILLPSALPINKKIQTAASSVALKSHGKCTNESVNKQITHVTSAAKHINQRQAILLPFAKPAKPFNTASKGKQAITTVATQKTKEIQTIRIPPAILPGTEPHALDKIVLSLLCSKPRTNSNSVRTKPSKTKGLPSDTSNSKTEKSNTMKKVQTKKILPQMKVIIPNKSNVDRKRNSSSSKSSSRMGKKTNVNAENKLQENLDIGSRNSSCNTSVCNNAAESKSTCKTKVENVKITRKPVVKINFDSSAGKSNSNIKTEVKAPSGGKNMTTGSNSRLNVDTEDGTVLENNMLNVKCASTGISEMETPSDKTTADEKAPDFKVHQSVKSGKNRKKKETKSTLKTKNRKGTSDTMVFDTKKPSKSDLENSQKGTCFKLPIGRFDLTASENSEKQDDGLNKYETVFMPNFLLSKEHVSKSTETLSSTTPSAEIYNMDRGQEKTSKVEDNELRSLPNSENDRRIGMTKNEKKCIENNDTSGKVTSLVCHSEENFGNVTNVEQLFEKESISQKTVKFPKPRIHFPSSIEEPENGGVSASNIKLNKHGKDDNFCHTDRNKTEITCPNDMKIDSSASKGYSGRVENLKQTIDFDGDTALFKVPSEPANVRKLKQTVLTDEDGFKLPLAEREEKLEDDVSAGEGNRIEDEKRNKNIEEMKDVLNSILIQNTNVKPGDVEQEVAIANGVFNDSIKENLPAKPAFLKKTTEAHKLDSIVQMLLMPKSPRKRRKSKVDGNIKIEHLGENGMETGFGNCQICGLNCVTEKSLHIHEMTHRSKISLSRRYGNDDDHEKLKELIEKSPVKRRKTGSSEHCTSSHQVIPGKELESDIVKSNIKNNDKVQITMSSPPCQEMNDQIQASFPSYSRETILQDPEYVSVNIDFSESTNVQHCENSEGICSNPEVVKSSELKKASAECLNQSEGSLNKPDSPSVSTVAMVTEEAYQLPQNDVSESDVDVSTVSPSEKVIDETSSHKAVASPYGGCIMNLSENGECIKRMKVIVVKDSLSQEQLKVPISICQCEEPKNLDSSNPDSSFESDISQMFENSYLSEEENDFSNSQTRECFGVYEPGDRFFKKDDNLIHECARTREIDLERLRKGSCARTNICYKRFTDLKKLKRDSEIGILCGADNSQSVGKNSFEPEQEKGSKLFPQNISPLKDALINVRKNQYESAKDLEVDNTLSKSEETKVNVIHKEQDNGGQSRIAEIKADQALFISPPKKRWRNFLKAEFETANEERSHPSKVKRGINFESEKIDNKAVVNKSEKLMSKIGEHGGGDSVNILTPSMSESLTGNGVNSETGLPRDISIISNHRNTNMPFLSNHGNVDNSVISDHVNTNPLCSNHGNTNMPLLSNHGEISIISNHRKTKMPLLSNHGNVDISLISNHGNTNPLFNNHDNTSMPLLSDHGNVDNSVISNTGNTNMPLLGNLGNVDISVTSKHKNTAMSLFGTDVSLPSYHGNGESHLSDGVDVPQVLNSSLDIIVDDANVSSNRDEDISDAEDSLLYSDLDLCDDKTWCARSLPYSQTSMCARVIPIDFKHFARNRTDIFDKNLH